MFSTETLFLESVKIGQFRTFCKAKLLEGKMVKVDRFWETSSHQRTETFIQNLWKFALVNAIDSVLYLVDRTQIIFSHEYGKELLFKETLHAQRNN